MSTKDVMKDVMKLVGVIGAYYVLEVLAFCVCALLPLYLIWYALFGWWVDH